MKVLVIDAWLPTPERDSASLRMFNLLRLLRELTGSVTLAADDYPSRQAAAEPLRRAGIEVAGPPRFPSVLDYIREAGPGFDVVWVSRVAVASKYLAAVRQFAPQARVVFDTTDLHYLRGFRGAKVTGNLSLLRGAVETKKQELAAARAAEVTLVVSPVEKAELEAECPGLRVQIVSNIHAVYGSARPFAEREGIVFVGAFPHHPNADAMRYFCQEVYPRLQSKLHSVRITLIGSQPPDWLCRLGSETLVVAGFVPDMAPYLERCRLTIAPLRYGAGVKGKVLLSMSYGVPVVATTVAAEGMPAQDRRDLLIADDAESFADRVAELYHDPALWQVLSENGLRLVQEHFSVPVARARLIELFESLGKPLHLPAPEGLPCGPSLP